MIDICLKKVQSSYLCRKDTTKELMYCSDSEFLGHPSCLMFTPAILDIARQYRWQCVLCESCLDYLGGDVQVYNYQLGGHGQDPPPTDDESQARMPIYCRSYDNLYLLTCLL